MHPFLVFVVLLTALITQSRAKPRRVAPASPTVVPKPYSFVVQDGVFYTVH